MISSNRLESAIEYVEWIRQAVHDTTLIDSNRNRAAASCFAISQDHHHAIVLLIEHRLYASSFSLMRSAFEAFVRGEWLSQCATDGEVDKFLACGEPPRINELLSAIEKTAGFIERVLSKIKQQNWEAMCGYTHTGGLHVQRWNTSGAIEPNYTSDEIEEILELTELIATMSALGLARIAGNDELALKILEKVKKPLS